MKSLLSLIVLLAIGGLGIYFTGVYREIQVERVMGTGPSGMTAHELNTTGVAAINSGNPQEAVSVLRRANVLDPDNRLISQNLSIALARVANDLTEDGEETVALLEESLRLWPRNAEALDGLSVFYFKEGRYREALAPALLLREMMPERADLSQYVTHLQQRVEAEKGMAAEKGDRFRLLYSSDRRLEYEGEILSVLQTQLDSLTAALGIFPERTVDVLVLTDDLGARADPMNPSLEGIYDGQIRLYVGEGIGDRDRFIGTVRHEMVHALLHQAAGILPGWVQEGLAQKVGQQPERDHMAAVRGFLTEKLKEGRRLDLVTSGMSFIELGGESQTMAYAASFMFFEFLSDRYGSALIPRFVAELASGMQPAEALEAVTGSSLAQLQDLFYRDLESGA